MPLLSTKLRTPPVRPDWVPRPRLIDRLNAGLRRKLTLISAPAGFGKTTLLSAWAHRGEHPVAWVSLDAGHDDPGRFWSYMLAALQTLHPGIAEAALPALQSPHPPLIETLLTGLINEIALLPAPFALILDDFHVINNWEIHNGITFLLNNLPPQMHLILATRADPPWPLAQLRARRDMVELRARDLRFTRTEAITFLNGVMKLGLAAEDAATLEERTEGWAVGLQMAALALQGRRATNTYDSATAFIKTFSGSHRFILDYLMEEVLDQQPGDVRDFLLQTSILEQMTAGLCDAVTGRSDSRQRLIQLERANLFLLPLDDERRWVRYHHLFADLLRSRLQEIRPGELPELHRRAGIWYESQGLTAEAIEHALIAGDVDRIEHLVAGDALAVIYRYELAALTRWLDALPETVRHARPRLCIAQAWSLAYAGQLECAEPLLQTAERAIVAPDTHAAGPPAHAEVQHLTGSIAAVRAYIAMLKGDLPGAAGLARVALDHLPLTDLAVRGWTTLVLGCTLRSQGETARATRTLADALAISHAAGNITLEVDVLWEQATLQLWQGRLRDVMRTCETALEVAADAARSNGRDLPVLGYMYALLAHVHCQRNNLETALHDAHTGLDLCRRWGQVDALLQSYLYLSNILRALGDTEGALDAVRKGRRAAVGLGPWYVITAGAFEARLQLASGDLPAAVRWMQESGLSIDEASTIEYGISYLVMVKILIAQGRLDESRRILAQLLVLAETAGAMGSAIGIIVLQALVLQKQGEHDRALTTLARALALAEPEGYVRIFIGEGTPMGDLLRQAVARGICPDYARRLLSALENEAPGPQRPATASQVPVSAAGMAALDPTLPPLTDPLSERELEVLRLLTTHLSSTGIADTLIISVNTARSHIKSIYSKLGVHTRKDAITRAQDLDLLHHLT